MLSAKQIPIPPIDAQSGANFSPPPLTHSLSVSSKPVLIEREKPSKSASEHHFLRISKSKRPSSAVVSDTLPSQTPPIPNVAESSAAPETDLSNGETSSNVKTLLQAKSVVVITDTGSHIDPTEKIILPTISSQVMALAPTPPAVLISSSPEDVSALSPFHHMLTVR